MKALPNNPRAKAPKRRTPADQRRIDRDNKTVVAMARIYCAAHHGTAQRDERGLCAECTPVIDYAIARTNACPHGHSGTCDTCTIQCYKPQMRAKIREIMAYSGPRMLTRHPIMALRHLAKRLASKKAKSTG